MSISFKAPSPLRKIVVKVGTSLLTNADNTLNASFFHGLVEQLTFLHQHQMHPLLVTSGSVASGRSEVKMKKESRNIPYRQALSAVGQALLMRRYHDLFVPKKISVAQALLTELDFHDRESFLNTRNTLELLLSLNVLPIINENDVVSYAGLKFGGNDWLAAKVAVMLGADLLILMTDIDGLYTDDPRKNPEARKIEEIFDLSEDIKKMAKNTASSKSIGGMISKLRAAEYASDAGIPTIFVCGTDENVLVQIVNGETFSGTILYPAACKLETSRQGWLRSHAKTGCAVIIDDGAVRALAKGGSLLPVGVKKIVGTFLRGDVITVKNLADEVVAFGQINYGSKDAVKIMACKTTELARILGHALLEDELIHRDNMARKVAS